MTDKFIPSTQFIEKLPNICVDLELVSVYDMDCYSVPQLLYRLAQKINDTITNMEHNDEALKAHLEDLQIKLEYLLGEGLTTELQKIFEKMYADGTLQSLVEASMVDIKRRLTVLEDKIDYGYIYTKNPGHGLVACKVDGVTDDADAFQAIVNYASANKMSIKLATGTMLVNKQIDLKSNITISGFGDASKIKTETGETLNGLNMLAAYEQENIVLENFYIENLGFGISGSWTPEGYFERAGACILMVGCTNVTVKGCSVIKGGGNGNGEGVGNIYFSCCYDSKIIDNFVSICDNAICVDTWYNKRADKLDFINSGVVVSGNNCSQGSGRGICIENVNSVGSKQGSITVTGNSITNFAYAGIQGNNPFHCVISNNVIDGDGRKRICGTGRKMWYGIEFLNNTIDCVMIGNTIKTVEKGAIRLFETSDLTVSNNIISDCDGDGMFLKNVNVPMERVNINNNTLTEVATTAIVVKCQDATVVSRDVTICGNLLNFKNRGIDVEYVKACKINGNMIKPQTNYGGTIGIRAIGYNFGLINSNRVEGCSIGLLLAGDVSSVVNDNLFISNTTGVQLNACTKTNIGSSFVGSSAYHAFEIVEGMVSASQRCKSHTSSFDGVKIKKGTTGLNVVLTGTSFNSDVFDTGDQIINTTPTVGGSIGQVYIQGSFRNFGTIG